jgi:hypothetical protein
VHFCHGGQACAKILTLLHQENKDNERKPLEMEISWICADGKMKHVGVPLDTIAAASVGQEQLEEDEEGMKEKSAWKK